MKQLQNLLQAKMTRKQFLGAGLVATASVFGVTGLLKELASHAATAPVAAEPEKGTAGGGAAVVTDSSASGGAAVKFTPPVQSTFQEFTAGSVKPLGYMDEAAGSGKRNVGPRPGVQLTRYNGDYTLRPGAKVSGLEIFGRLIGRGDSTTLVEDCIVHGSAAAATAAAAMAVGTSYDFGGAVFKWCRFDHTGYEDGFTDGIAGGNYTMKYCEITRSVDGVACNIVGKATIECCRIWSGHYDSWWDDAANTRRSTTYTDADGKRHDPPFPNQSSGDLHSDGIQIHQYGGWVIHGCYIGAARTKTYPTKLDPTIRGDLDAIKAIDKEMEFHNAAILISSANQAYPVGAVIESNWLGGGAATLNIAYKAYDDMRGVTIRNNRFIRSSGYAIYSQQGVAANITGNVYDNDGSAVNRVVW